MGLSQSLVRELVVELQLLASVETLAAVRALLGAGHLQTHVCQRAVARLRSTLSLITSEEALEGSSHVCCYRIHELLEARAAAGELGHAGLVEAINLIQFQDTVNVAGTALVVCF